MVSRILSKRSLQLYIRVYKFICESRSITESQRKVIKRSSARHSFLYEKSILGHHSSVFISSSPLHSEATGDRRMASRVAHCSRFRIHQSPLRHSPLQTTVCIKFP